MQHTATQTVRDKSRLLISAPISRSASVERTPSAGLFGRLMTTVSKGESEWTPVLVIVLVYALWIPTLLLMLGLAELAYHFG